MKRLTNLLALFALSFLLGACGTAYGIYYTVKKGDTVQSIAARHNATVDSLTQANTLSKDEVLSPGSSLFIPGVTALPSHAETVNSEPLSQQADSSPYKREQEIAEEELVRDANLETSFTMPVQGRVVKKFKEQGSEGVDFACRRGEKVVAAAAGKVLFASAHKSFGNTVIIQHSKSLITVYAFLSEFRTKEGATVKLGELIAICGQSGINVTDALHFEVRLGGKPVDPLTFQPE